MLTGKRITILFIIAFIALVLGLWFGHVKQQQQLAKPIHATVLQEPRALSPFQLKDGKNQIFSNTNLVGHWSLIYFGFTSCPHICPTTLNVLNQIYTRLQSKLQTLPQVIFISVDPERDTPAHTQKYAAGFNSHFMGLTGSSDQIDKLTHELSVVYMKIKPNVNPDDYQIDHSDTLLLLDPTGKLQAVFSGPYEAEGVAQDIAMIMAA